MSPRPEGPDPPEPWTIKVGERWLLTPMRDVREGLAFVAHPGNALAPVDLDRPSATFDILAFARTVLGKGIEEVTAVITRSRLQPFVTRLQRSSWPLYNRLTASQIAPVINATARQNAAGAFSTICQSAEIIELTFISKTRAAHICSPPHDKH